MKCLSPLKIPNPRYLDELGEVKYLNVPCGKCPACLWNKREEWALRCELESKRTPFQNYFFTLTYNQLNLPLFYDEKTQSVLPYFPKEHVRNFLKNLSRLAKKYNNGVTPRYILVSEYSPAWRPHYHGILFGHSNESNVSNYLTQCWSTNKHPLGTVQVGRLLDGGSRYCLKYLFKQNYDARLPLPLFRCSRRPGIGRFQMSPALKESIHERYRKIFPSAGSFLKLPRILASEVFTDDELQEIGETQSSEMVLEDNNRLLALLAQGLSPEQIDRIQRDERRQTWNTLQRKINNSCKHSKNKLE